MIISQTPLRMSFVGGGSDLPAFYRKYGGAVVSTAIDKFIYVGVNRKFDQSIRISYSKTEEVATVDQIEHRLVREALRMLGIRGGIEITSIADIPSRGTGLGSSSSFSVGLLHALHAYLSEYVSSETLGDESRRLELDRCGSSSASRISMPLLTAASTSSSSIKDDAVSVSPVICDIAMLTELNRWLMMFYTGVTRSADSILNNQTAAMVNDGAKQEIVVSMVRLAHQLRDELHRNRLESFGDILHENWVLKKRLSEDISSSLIDEVYDAARKQGAIGGKLLGAGAGGFLVFFVPPHRQTAVREALAGMREVPFTFERRGSRITLFQS